MPTEIISGNERERIRRGLSPFEQRIRAVNQRLSVRHELRARVEFCWIDEKGTLRHGVGHTRDISTKGAYIFHSAVCPITGTPVAMDIEIRFSATTARVLLVQTKGNVVRVEQPGREGTAGGFAVQNDRVSSFRNWTIV